MKEQIKILVDLQRIEAGVAALESALAAVPQSLASLDADLQLVEKAISEKENVFKEQKKSYRNQEADVQGISERIRASQTKLGAVKNNKEYQALLKEIDELKVKSSAIEDDMLEFLEHMDQTEADIAAQRARYRHHVEATEAEKAGIAQEADEKRAQLEQLQNARAQTVARLDPALLARFNKVKAAHSDGLAVAYVENAVCSGCHLNIPPQMFNELQKCEIIRLCPTCERIIYWREI